MTYDAIREMPTSLKAEQWRTGNLRTSSGVHESCLRSYHVLGKVKELLDLGAHPSIIKELVHLMESELPKVVAPSVEFPWKYDYLMKAVTINGKAFTLEFVQSAVQEKSAKDFQTIGGRDAGNGR